LPENYFAFAQLGQARLKKYWRLPKQGKLVNYWQELLFL
jgi:hypothetical protein